MIAIPNMDKPKACEKCPAHSFTFGDEYVSAHDYCGALKKPFNEKKLDIDPFKEILPDCLLIDIVTCGECKWSYIDKQYGGTMWCKVHFHHYRVNSDGFCSYGEREDE